MFDSLFGTEGSLVVRYVVALIIVLGLIALALWLFRRFTGGRVSAGAARGRQPRLAVVDAASVDSRRRLVLVRRDNVEHLIMIGGPTDIVVEQNIVRAVPVTAPREMPVPRTPGAVEAATSARAPAGDEAPHAPAEPVARSAPEFPRIPRPEPAPRPPRVADSLARLGMPLTPPPRPAPEPIVPAPAPIVPAAEPAPEPASSATPADAALASMAQRLEAALRRPPGSPEPAKPAEPALEVPPSDSPATAPQASPSKASSDIDSLQEEMANILGRRLTKDS